MSLKRNTFYNLTGSVLPIAVSLVTVPMYLHYVGVERYGVLAIVWMLLGYFGFFDLGLPRATANQVAKMKDATPTERQEFVWTALVLNSCFGLLGSLAVYLVAPPLLEHVFKMESHLRVEVVAALPWMACAIPLATITGVLVGALDGRERFLIVNSLQALSTILFQIIPLAVAIAYGAQLQWIVAAAVLVRVFTAVMLYVALAKEFPNRHARFDMKWVKPLLSYGGWVSVTGFILPILESIDRFIIGAVLGARSVAIYTVPFNLVSRLRILPIAINRTLFPRLSSINHEGADELSLRAMNLLVAIFTPVIVVGMFLVKPFMVIWVGNEIAQEAAPLAMTLMVGVWINGLAHIPFCLLEAKGRPDLIAKLHLSTLPIFAGLLWSGAHYWGIQGVALAWMTRVWIDSNILFWMAGLLKPCWRKIWQGGFVIIFSCLLAMIKPDAVMLCVILILISFIWAWTIEPIFRQTGNAVYARLKLFLYEINYLR